MSNSSNQNFSKEEKEIQNNKIITKKLITINSKRGYSFWSLFGLYWFLFRKKLRTNRDFLIKRIFYFALAVLFFISFSGPLLYFIEAKNGSLPLFLDAPLQLIEDDNYRFFYAAYIVVIGLCTSILAANFIDISQRLGEEHNKAQNGFKLRLLLNSTHHQKNTAIVLPKYPIAINRPESLGFEKSYYRKVHNEDWETKQKQKLSDPDKIKHSLHYFTTLAYQDVIASANVVNMFEFESLPRPRLVPDLSITDEFINDKTKRINPTHKLPYKTFICMGLFSNEMTMWINNTILPKAKVGRFFKLESRKDGETNRLGKIYLAGHNKDKTLQTRINKWTHHEFEGKIDTETGTSISYGLFAKIFHEGYCFIIIGGLSANCTVEIGKHIRKNWQDILEYEDTDTKRRIEVDKSFAIVFTLSDNKVVEENASIHVRIDK